MARIRVWLEPLNGECRITVAELENARWLRLQLMGQGVFCSQPKESNGKYVLYAKYTMEMSHADVEKFLTGLDGVELITGPP